METSTCKFIHEYTGTMPKKSWDFKPIPTEQHRRIAAEHAARELLSRLRSHEGLREAADLLVGAVESVLGAEELGGSREYQLRRVAGALMSDAIFRKIQGQEPDNS